MRKVIKNKFREILMGNDSKFKLITLCMSIQQPGSSYFMVVWKPNYSESYQIILEKGDQQDWLLSFENLNRKPEDFGAKFLVTLEQVEGYIFSFMVANGIMLPEKYKAELDVQR